MQCKFRWLTKRRGSEEKQCCFTVLPKPLSNTKAKVLLKKSLKFSWKALLFLKTVRTAQKIFLEQKLKKPVLVELQSWSFVNFWNTRPENFPFQALFHFYHSSYTQPYTGCSSRNLPCPQFGLNFPEEEKLQEWWLKEEKRARLGDHVPVDFWERALKTGHVCCALGDMQVHNMAEVLHRESQQLLQYLWSARHLGSLTPSGESSFRANKMKAACFSCT